MFTEYAAFRAVNFDPTAKRAAERTLNALVESGLQARLEYRDDYNDYSVSGVYVVMVRR